jgi:hypothetical protein
MTQLSPLDVMTIPINEFYSAIPPSISGEPRSKALTMTGPEGCSRKFTMERQMCMTEHTNEDLIMQLMGP